MSIINIWVKEDDMETVRRLKKFLEHQVEKEFEDKDWRWSSTYYRKGKSRRKRLTRPRINNSHIFRQALYYYWLENELQVRAFEKSKKYR